MASSISESNYTEDMMCITTAVTCFSLNLLWLATIAYYMNRALVY